jgi:small subunit ribosomal protein S17
MIKQRKIRIGHVVSNKMNKTVVVLVERLRQHPRYKRYVRYRKKFKAHDELNQCGLGDLVRIIETRPLSKEKRWKVVEILEKGKEVIVKPSEVEQDFSRDEQ